MNHEIYELVDKLKTAHTLDLSQDDRNKAADLLKDFADKQYIHETWTKTYRLSYRADGDTNFYTVLSTVEDRVNWFARVQLNGELMPQVQEVVMTELVTTLNEFERYGGNAQLLRQVEETLCEFLGISWEPEGQSITSLLAEIGRTAVIWQDVGSCPNDVDVLIQYDDGSQKLIPAKENDYSWQPYKENKPFVVPKCWCRPPRAYRVSKPDKHTDSIQVGTGEWAYALRVGTVCHVLKVTFSGTAYTFTPYDKQLTFRKIGTSVTRPSLQFHASTVEAACDLVKDLFGTVFEVVNL